MRSSADQDEFSLVKGEVSVYLDNGDENQVWVILKRTSGDPFQFREVFDTIISHPQTIERLVKNKVENE